jgi:pyroglutamyl-peptidase
MISRNPLPPCVLVTGFEPFGADVLNPSWLLAQSLDGETVCGHDVVARQLPTVFGDAPKTLRAHMRSLKPQWVVCLGQADGRAALGFERVAINVDDAPIADNAGRTPSGTPIAPRGPVAYWSSLPIQQMVNASLAVGVPAEVSNTAGTFVCNHVFYSLMRTLVQARWRARGARGGFVHVPFLPEQGQPNLSLAHMRAGLLAALTAALDGAPMTSSVGHGRIA